MVKHKTLPLSIKEFKNAYDVSDPNLQEEYKVYLTMNSDRHRYGKLKTRTAWQQNAVTIHRTI